MTVFFALTMGALSASLPAQDSTNFPALGKVVKLDPALDAVLDESATIEVLASGFVWSEGPVWVPDAEAEGGGYVLFSDVPRNHVIKWEEGKGAEVWMEPSGFTGPGDYGAEPGSNGLALDAKGQLHFCEHGDRRISYLTKGGGKRTLVDHWQGKRFNSPNDLCFASNGDLYFTDPPYGLPGKENDPTRETDHFGVYRVGADGVAHLVTADLQRPNGIALSPDEKTLYVAQSHGPAALWMAYPVQPDGGVGEGRVLHDVTESMGKRPGAPDGLKIDDAGNLWATGPGGVHVITPEGKLLGRIDTGERTGNCCWGNDGSVLYVCSDTYLVRIQTKTRGARWADAAKQAAVEPDPLAPGHHQVQQHDPSLLRPGRYSGVGVLSNWSGPKHGGLRLQLHEDGSLTEYAVTFASSWDYQRTHAGWEAESRRGKRQIVYQGEEQGLHVFGYVDAGKEATIVTRFETEEARGARSAR